MMFGRKMKTKLPQNQKKKRGSDREEEARARHDLKKSQQKEAFDKRQKAKEKKLNKGDEVLIQQKKTSVRSPWDPEGFEVTGVKGSKVTLKRGEETKTRAKNHVKVVEKRPKELETGAKIKKKRGPELDLEVSWDRIQAMGDPADAAGRDELRQADGAAGGADQAEAQAHLDSPGPPEEEEDLPGPQEEEEEEDTPELPESEEEEEEEEEGQGEEAEQEGDEQGEEVQGGGHGRVAELEGVRLMDSLHLGGYWPVQEGAGRRRKPPPRLGVEQERGFWEERLPRELSMGDPGSRQLTPQPSPQPSPPALQPDQPTGFTDYEYQQLPASRSWDDDEIAALQLDLTKAPRCNLICFHHFCPDWAGEEEPDQMQESKLPRPGTE